MKPDRIVFSALVVDVPHSELECSVIPLRRCIVAVVVQYRENGCFCCADRLVDNDGAGYDDGDDGEVGAALPMIIIIFASS